MSKIRNQLSSLERKTTMGAKNQIYDDELGQKNMDDFSASSFLEDSEILDAV